MTTACGNRHVGQCTTGPTFTRAEAEQKLLDLGWAWKGDTAEWVKGEERGRLAWQPDYCHPDDTERGTRFYLRQPYTIRTSGLEVLP